MILSRLKNIITLLNFKHQDGQPFRTLSTQAMNDFVRYVKARGQARITTSGLASPSYAPFVLSGPDHAWNSAMLSLTAPLRPVVLIDGVAIGVVLDCEAARLVPAVKDLTAKNVLPNAPHLGVAFRPEVVMPKLMNVHVVYLRKMRDGARRTSGPRRA